MKTEIKIKNEEIKELLDVTSFDFPLYTSQILNLANQNAQATRPKIVGQMSELIQEFEGRTVKEWETWYLKKHPNAIEDATEKLSNMIENLKLAINKIDDALIKDWVKDLVIYKTFIGLKFQEAVLKRVSSYLEKKYRLANVDEEAHGIDGLIGKVPVSIKPVTYKVKRSLSEEILVRMIYYEKAKDGLKVDFSELTQ